MNILLLIVGIFNIILLIVLIYLTWKNMDESLTSEGVANIYHQQYQDVKKELRNQENMLIDIITIFNKILEDSNIVIDQYGDIRYKDKTDDSDTVEYIVEGGYKH